LSAAPGAFDPGVVVLLVGQGVVRGPVLERGPADRIVLAVTAACDEVEEGERAVGVVLGAVLERVGDPLRGEGLAADEPAAERLVGHDVVVRVDEPAHLARGVRTLERLPGDADPGVGRGPGDRIPPVAAGGGTGRGHEGRGQHEEEQRYDPEVSSGAVRGHYARPSVAELS
jgi:hypothetical protein